MASCRSSTSAATPLRLARRRRSDIDAAAGPVNPPERIVAQIREACPEVKILTRAESVLCREEILRWREVNRVDYLILGRRTIANLRCVGTTSSIKMMAGCPHDGSSRDSTLMASSPIDDTRLRERVRRAVDGDARAWDDLLADHRGRLRRMVALRLDRRLLARLDPSDVVQEVCVEALAGLAEFQRRKEMPFFLWMRWLTGIKLATLHRKHLGYQVRDAGREVCLDHGALPEATSAAIAAQLLGRETSASALAMRLERKVRIEEAIDAMDPIDREVLVLRHFEELTNAEVARTLGIPQATSSKRYIRALRRLKEALQTMPGGSTEFRP